MLAKGAHKATFPNQPSKFENVGSFSKLVARMEVGSGHAGGERRKVVVRRRATFGSAKQEDDIRQRPFAAAKRSISRPVCRHGERELFLNDP